MLEEIVISSLLVSSLGMQALAIGAWKQWQQVFANQQNDEEEEILTQYEAKENTDAAPSPLNGIIKQLPKDPRQVGWEFKIVRASRNLFRDPAVLQRLCEEEAEAGWILLEKLDDSRVRFKRPMAMRDVVKSEFLTYDPYRCHYGPSWQPLTWLGVVTALVAMTLPAYLGYVLVSQTLNRSRSVPPPPTTFPLPERSPSP